MSHDKPNESATAPFDLLQVKYMSHVTNYDQLLVAYSH